MKLDALTLFISGVCFSFLSYLGNSLEENRYVGKSKKVVFFIILGKALLGGSLAVLVFYGLAEITSFNEYIRVGLAATAAILTENSKKFLLLFVRQKIGAEK